MYSTPLYNILLCDIIRLRLHIGHCIPYFILTNTLIMLHKNCIPFIISCNIHFSKNFWSVTIFLSLLAKRNGYPKEKVRSYGRTSFCQLCHYFNPYSIVLKIKSHFLRVQSIFLTHINLILKDTKLWIRRSIRIRLKEKVKAKTCKLSLILARHPN